MVGGGLHTLGWEFTDTLMRTTLYCQYRGYTEFRFLTLSGGGVPRDFSMEKMCFGSKKVEKHCIRWVNLLS